MRGRGVTMTGRRPLPALALVAQILASALASAPASRLAVPFSMIACTVGTMRAPSVAYSTLFISMSSIMLPRSLYRSTFKLSLE
jgi:hypothetical protein